MKSKEIGKRPMGTNNKQPLLVAEQLLLRLVDANGKEWHAVGLLTPEVTAVGDSEDKAKMSELFALGELKVAEVKIVKETI